MLDEWVIESSHQDVRHHVPSCGIPNDENVGKNDEYTDFIVLHLRYVYEQQLWGDRMAVKDVEYERCQKFSEFVECEGNCRVQYFSL